MDFIPRYSQPFTLSEAISLDVAVITEGNKLALAGTSSSRPTTLDPIDPIACRNHTTPKLFATPKANSKHAPGIRGRIARRSRSRDYKGIGGEQNRDVRLSILGLGSSCLTPDSVAPKKNVS